MTKRTTIDATGNPASIFREALERCIPEERRAADWNERWDAIEVWAAGPADDLGPITASFTNVPMMRDGVA